jgi:hypothetical protein
MTSPASLPTHPSYLALDRFSLGGVASDVAPHLEICAECRAYVASLTESAPASGIVAVKVGIERQRRSGLLVWWTASSVLAAAACLLLVFGRFSPPPIATVEDPASSEGVANYVGAKGLLSVWIYVKRGPITQLWDGKTPVLAGDRLRIKVDPAGYDRVEVYSLQEPEAPALLYAGAVSPGHDRALPEAWEIDGEGSTEHLIVVFSNGAVKPTWDKWLRGEVESGVAVLPFVLPKSSAPPPDTSGSP